MATTFRHAALALSLCGVALPAAAGAPAIRSIAIPGDGGWDYARVDDAGHRLYVAHGDEVAVVDLSAGRPLPPLAPVAHAHGVMPLATGEVAVTSGGDASVRFFDTGTGRQVASVAVGDKPDAAIIDPATGHLLAMDATSGDVADIDVASHRLTRRIKVAKGLEYAAVVGRTLFVNNEDRNALEVVDLAHGERGTPIPLPGCDGSTGLGLDAAHHRLISACANGVAAIVDANARRLVQRVPIGRGPDAVIVDARRSLAYIPAGKDGRLDILSLAAPHAVARKGSIATQGGARTGALDARTGIVWLPVAKLLPAVDGGKPKPVPGTFHVLGVHPA